MLFCKVKTQLFLLALLILPLTAFCQLPVPQWVNDFGGSGDSKVTAMVADKQNNIYVAGYFSGTVDFDPSAGVKNLTSAGGYDIYIGKYSQTGALIWAESIGSDGLDQVNYMCVDASGNPTIIGQTNSAQIDADPGPGTHTLTGHNAEDAFIIHLDTNGGFGWATLVGGFGTDRGEEINADSQGNVIATIVTTSNPIDVGTTTYKPQTWSSLIIKYDSGGNILWQMMLGNGNETWTFGVAVDSNNDILVSGTFGGTINFNPMGVAHNVTAPNANSPYLAKYTAAGQLVWVQVLSGSLVSNNSFINVDSKNNVFLSGTYNGTLKFTANSSITASPYQNNMFVAKFLPDGTFVWGKGLNGAGDSFAYQMQTDQDSNVYLTGYFTGTIDFNPDDATTANLTSQGRSFFLVKFDEDGNYKWAFNAGSPNCDSTLGIELAINANRDLFLGGSFCSTVDFDPSNCTDLKLTAKNGMSDSFIADYSQYLSSSVQAKITGFSIPQQVGATVIDDAHAKITITMPAGTDLTSLIPTITVNGASTLTPATGVARNFTNPVNYVLSTNCSSLTYTVVVNTTIPSKPFNLCNNEGGTLTGDNVTITPDSYLWQINQNGAWNNAPGVNNQSDYTIAANTYSNTTGAPVVYNFKRVTTKGGIDTEDSFYLLTVNPGTENNTITAGTTDVCAGQNTGISFTGNQPTGYTAAVVYAWQQSADQNTWTDLNASQQNYQYTAPVTQTVYIRRQSTLGSCVSYSNTMQINVLPAVTVANAGNGQQVCNQPQVTLAANAPGIGETGTWSVVSPATYNPFDAVSIHNPQAVINNLPLGIQVQLKWTILKTSCGQQSESTVAIINQDKPSITGFTLPQQAEPAVINQTSHTITITVNEGTDIRHLAPVISNTGTLSPASGTQQDFTGAVNYTVSNNCANVVYNVTVKTVQPEGMSACSSIANILLPGKILASGATYQWQQYSGTSWNDLSSGTGYNYIAVPPATAPGTIQTVAYRCRVTLNGADTYSPYYDVSFYPQIAGSVITADHAFVCYGDNAPVVFTGNVPSGAAPGNTVTYTWQRSPDNSSWTDIGGATQQSFQYTTGNRAPVYIRRKASSGGCADLSNSIQITFGNQLTQADAGTAQPGCEGSPIQLAANSAAANEVGTWSVVSPAGYNPFTAANINNPQASISNVPLNTDVILRWTISGTQCQTATSGTVTVRATSLPLVTTGQQVFIDAGESTTLNGSITGQDYTYSWSPATGLSSSTELNPVATPFITTVYTLTATTSAGCMASASVKVVVNTTLKIPNTITPNGDGINDTWVIKNLENYQDVDVNIYNRYGIKVYYSRGYPSPWNGTYKGAKLPAGVYYYLIKVNDLKMVRSGPVTVLY